MTDTEVLEGALCLCAPKYVRRDVNLTEAVGFGSNIGHRIFFERRHCTVPLQQIRGSVSNRTAVTFAIKGSSAETSHALKAGSSFTLERPLTLDSIRHTLNAAYGLIVRERRRYFRYPISVPAAASRKGEAEVFGRTVNISERGMAFSGPIPLRPGSEVKVECSLTNPQLAITTECKVCWTNDRAQSGLSFLFMPSNLSSELQAWLGQKLEEQLPGPVTRRFQ